MAHLQSLISAYEYLRNSGQVHTKQEIASKMNASKSNVSSAFNGDAKCLTDRFIKRFNDAFGGIFNESWLLTGEGSMLNTPSVVQNNMNGDNINGNNVNEIKYFQNIEGSMGGVQFLDNPDETYTPIIVPGYSDCNFAINAYGDSMHPLIRSGQIVLLSEWTERFIDWGKIYLVVTKSGYRSIKRLHPAEQPDKIKCVSENSNDFPPYEIETRDILKLYLVKGWICRNAI